jgi:hypothetical protein
MGLRMGGDNGWAPGCVALVLVVFAIALLDTVALAGLGWPLVLPGVAAAVVALALV